MAERFLYEFQVYIWIPILIGVAVGTLYSMLFVKKGYHPIRRKDERGKLQIVYLGWIGFSLLGLGIGMIVGSVSQFFELSLQNVLTIVILGTFIACHTKYKTYIERSDL